MALLPSPKSESVVAFGTGKELTLRIARRGKDRSILLVALNRPRVKNAFNDEQYLDLISVLQHASIDDSIAAVVLTGEGSYFTSGADLKETNLLPEDDDEDEGGSGKSGMLGKPPGRFMMELIKFPKIICSAVNGPTVGIGVTLLLHCDLCYCTEDATFWAPFTRLALVPELCSSKTFVDTMGLSKANDLLILGKKIDAITAVRNNICSDIIIGCDKSGNPFEDHSIGSKMCREIDERLISLPLGDKTSKVRCALFIGICPLIRYCLYSKVRDCNFFQSLYTYSDFCSLSFNFVYRTKIFVSMIRSRRRNEMEKVCKEELLKLDERVASGETLEASMQLNFGSSRRSKL